MKLEERIAYLIHRKLSDVLSPEEQQELERLEQDENIRQATDQLKQGNIAAELEVYDSIDLNRGRKKFYQALETAGEINRKRWWQQGIIKAAAAILVITGITTFYLTLPEQQNNQVSVSGTTDIYPPPDNKVHLTLANGKVISLDTAANGLLAVEGTSSLNHSNEGLSYKKASRVIRSDSHLYNSISTPVGGMYKLILEDGTKVWLNATSTLRYPVSFDEDIRRVELIGEAFFEVAGNPRQPFIVTARDQEIKVLGTQFNVNAYPDNAESQIITTLFKGAVQVSRGMQKLMLKPGQAAYSSSQQNLQSAEADLDAAGGWRNGLIVFRNLPIEDIMKMAERNYNILVRYEGKVTNSFSGIIEKKLPVSNFLGLLSKTSFLHYEITDGNLIVIRP